LQTKGHELAVLSAKLNLDRFGRDIARHVQDLEALAQRFARAGVRSLTECTAKIESLAARLESISFHNVLARGYALVRDASGAPVISVAGVPAGAAIQVEFADGKVDARVEGGGAKPQTKPARKPDPGQGTLL
jgi:exodeoxyribonuclease VII large subunit